MTKIEKLTKEQEARFPLYVKKWLDIGLSCEPINKERVQSAINEAYSCAGLKTPQKISLALSPYAGARRAASYVEKKEEKELTKEEIGKQLNTAGYGAQDAGWLAFYDFFKEELKLKNMEKIEGLLLLSQECGWYWPFENEVILTERPAELRFDERNRLHCETGPSIKYRDGFSVFSWHGVKIPESWIMNKKSLTPQIALKHQNTEQRKAACEILGWNNIIKELKAKTIDKNKDPQIGELLEINTPEIGKEKFLRVLCGTGREFSIPVPPDMKTALQANAWTYNLDETSYRPEVRT